MLQRQRCEDFREGEVQRHRHDVVHDDAVGALDVRTDLLQKARDQRVVRRRSDALLECGEVALHGGMTRVGLRDTDDAHAARLRAAPAGEHGDLLACGHQARPRVRP